MKTNRNLTSIVGIRVLGRQRWIRVASWLHPPKKQLATYDYLFELAKRYNVDTLSGDVLEIGVFLGVGTRQLAKRFPTKTIYAVDTFQLDFNSDKYLHLRNFGPSQWDVFQKHVKGLWNVRAQPCDSKFAYFHPKTRFCLAFIDGDHSPEYVLADFKTAWNRLIPGGVIVFDDLMHPDCAGTINQLLKKHLRDGVVEIRPELNQAMIRKHPLGGRAMTLEEPVENPSPLPPFPIIITHFHNH